MLSRVKSIKTATQDRCIVETGQHETEIMRGQKTGENDEKRCRNKQGERID